MNLSFTYMMFKLYILTSYEIYLTLIIQQNHFLLNIVTDIFQNLD